MLEHVDIRKILFVDVETVPAVADYENLDEQMQTLWAYRTNRFKPEELTAAAYYFEKAGVYAEFAKVICISVGFFARATNEGKYEFRVKTFAGHEEKELLLPFLNLLEKYFTPDRYYMCGHNITEFDVPFLCRRAVINGYRLPNMLNLHRFKPWETPFIDTLRIWKFGEYRNFTSLKV